MLGIVHQERARFVERWRPIPERSESFLGNMDFQEVLEIPSSDFLWPGLVWIQLERGASAFPTQSIKDARPRTLPPARQRRPKGSACRSTWR